VPGAVAQTRYARSGDVHIAYQVVGEGPLDLVWIPSLSHHVELNWENPAVAPRLASLGRLIVFDKRGTGMSDRVSSDTTLETRMDDIRAVMSSAGSEIVFADHGPAELKGIPGEWLLFAVERAAA
jgi:pimeloyl-ACP methyl ester carboxylesterase